ncbi:MAG: TonB family protein [Bacteroidales bacterium]|nr:TonB family protein [Bacteroidales bacterium]
MKAINLNNKMKFLKSIFLMLSILLTTIITAQPPEKEDKSLSPYFFVKSDDPAIDQLPLESTEAFVNIAGIIADVKVVQTYKNEGQKALEAIYVFPASTRAAVYAMQMTIGERTIVAKINEKEKARKDYEEALEAGKSASLLEQQRPNVFQMNVGNIMPGDIIKVELNYTELLIPEEGIYEFVYPTVVGPRYAGKEKDMLASNDNWVANPYSHEGELPTYTFGLEVKLTSPVPVTEVTSTSHEIDVNFRSKRKAKILLSENDKYGGNRDFILRYKLKGKGIESGILLYEGAEENFFMTMIQPPDRITPEVIPPREYVFIVDVSGSMYGTPLDISKKLLKDLIGGLKPTDKFNVLLFAGGNSLLSEHSLNANKTNIQKAIQFIDKEQGGGGTELLPALNRALKLEGTEDYSRTFIIATDGYVTVEKETFDLIKKNLGNANFFAFGIGSSVNRHLLEGMAHVGKGTPFIVTNDSETKTVPDKFREYISSPVLTNIKINFPGFNAYDVEPMNIPDVFAERPVIVFGKYRGNTTGKITLQGSSGQASYEKSIDIASAITDNDNQALRYLWARERIRELDDFNFVAYDDKHVKDITSLGLKYNLLTQYTSFVAIDSEVRNNSGEHTTVSQPLPLPDGVSDYAIGAVQNCSYGGGSKGLGLFRSKKIKGNAAKAPEMAIEPDLEEFLVEDKEPVFTVVEIMPVFKDGIDALKKFIQDNMIYPQKAKDRGISGSVFVTFEVDTDGSVTNVEVLNSLDPLLDAEAVRLILLTDKMWNPGEQRGKPVRVTMNVKVDFVL